MTKPVAFITGAAKRVGAVIATELHAAGFRVVIHYHRSKQAAVELAAHLNQQQPDTALLLAADLRQQDAAQRLMDACISWSGRLDVLVNNASLFSRHDTDWADLFACNVAAPYWLSMAAYPHLAVTQGAIINITDVHARVPLRGYAVYCQSKAALEMQTKALAVEFAPKVRVNAVAPGATLWPEGDNSLGASAQAQIVAKTLLQRHGDPQYIAQAVLFLMNNKFITGQSIGVDGGRYLGHLRDVT